jgi:eukaryotic-like serine/threonine-protein kinase
MAQPSSPRSWMRVALAGVLLFSFLIFAIQLSIVRPRLWPAGADVTLSGDTVFASLSEAFAIRRIRPPDIHEVIGSPIAVTQVRPGSTADRDGLAAGAAVGVEVPIGTEVLRYERFPLDAPAVLDLWRRAYYWTPRQTIYIDTPGSGQRFALERKPVWELDSGTRNLWLRQHLGVIVQMGAFLLGALILVALGSRGMTATLMTLALVVTAIANGGPMYGAELEFPVIGGLLLVFGWLVTPLAFPIIGLAVLFFPSRAAILDRYHWIYPGLAAASAPMFVISIVAAAFLLGVDSAIEPLAWFTRHGWIFDASFAVALGANLVIVAEGVNRYRHNEDVNERRRIQIVVYTGVPAVFAYAVKAGVPLLSSLVGRPVELPVAIEAVLQAIVLLPSVALPYAVAVKRVFSPRTVLRRSLQYALARRTLSILIVLPFVALGFSLVTQRSRPLGDIVLEQPLFYLISLTLAVLAFRYRDQAQGWLDRRFFRAEYDAREILVSLANRVPHENDPATLVSMVMTEVDNALQPESIAVLAGEERQLDVMSTRRTTPHPLPRDSGLATLLRWSDEPLEVFLDDEHSPAARLPAADRAWVQAAGVSLLVPILVGSGERQSLIGVIALGNKRSEEPYTPEDRRLLSGIAAQMGLALDLSRLRRRVSTGEAERIAASADEARVPSSITSSPTIGFEAASLVMCPACHRCFDPAAVRGADGHARCPTDNNPLQPVLGIPVVVDGKYRIDALVGRGGMGAVFRARDLRLERDVAIKTVSAELVADSVSRTRFQREAQIVARLQHPAIVTVFDFGSLPHGSAFLVMEFVPGEDLRQLLTREKTLPLDRTIDLISGVAAGVDAAHRAGVLHRDLKPENILLPASGAGPKVLDFGVAKMTDLGGDSSHTITHGATIVGTPAYMAPEQLRGETVDGRADVYSLAVVTYEAITGRLPFGTGSFIDVGIKQADGSQRIDVAELPSHLADLLRQALSLDRDERPPTAATFAERLRIRPS